MVDQPARSRRASRAFLAWPFVVGSVGVVTLAAAVSDDRVSQDMWLVFGGMTVFTIVGFLIETRRQGQVVGRLCLVIGGLLMLTALFGLAAAVLDARPGRLPALGAALAVLGSTLFILVILLMGPLLISRFPDGQRPGRLARLVDVLLVMSGLFIALTALRPGPIQWDWLEAVDNPFGLDPLAPLTGDTPFGFLIYGATSVLAMAGLIRRYLDGTPVVRAQIRWFAASIALNLGLLVGVFLTFGRELQPLNDFMWTAWVSSLLLPPIAIGVAILRYRLYDIDRIVSNTIGYGLVTMLLLGLFTVVNLVLVSQVSPLVNNEGVAVAGSTLLVAALFNPLRTRVQAVIDRRFHRARYDADRMASEFAARLRDQLDLATVAGDLASTSARAVEPTTSRVWLRGPG